MKCTKREFLAAGGMAAAGACVAPSLPAAEADEAKQSAAMMKHFAVSERDVRSALEAALEKGGDYADLYFEHTSDNTLGLMDGRVSEVTVNLMDSTSYVLLVNSDGRCVSDYRPMAALSTTCVMQENGVYENGRAARSFRMGFEFLADALIEELAQQAVKETAMLFKASKPKGGEMPVVLGSGQSGIFLHEAIGRRCT